MDFQLNTKITKRIQLSSGRFVLLLMPVVGLFLMPNISFACSWYDLICKLSPQDAYGQAQSVIVDSSIADVYEPMAPANNIDPLPKDIPAPITSGGDSFSAVEGPSTAAPDSMDNNPNGLISIYTVRSGDTLAKVANMFDVSVNTILWANDMTKGSTLKIGQTLVILPINGVMHTVVAGDTLKSIAKKYSGDLNEIADFNDLAITDKLAIGETIMIPDGEASTSIRPSATGPSKLFDSNGPSYAGYYMKPFIIGTRTQGIHGHNGVDYGMPVGSPLYAAASGVVIISKSSGYNGGYGKYIVIQHPNGTQTVYGHMSNPAVSVGQSVSQGQYIGASGNTGKSTGPHLHLEVRGAKNPF